MKKSLLISTLFIGVLNTACTPTFTPQQTLQTTPTSRTTAPLSQSTNSYYQLQTIQGPTLTVGERSNGFTFPQYQGKIVILQIFGKECPYCFEEMPIIHNMHQKYGRVLEVVAIQAQEPMSRATASNLIHRFQMDYPIIERDEAADLLLFMRQTYGWNGILPYMLIIKNGVTEYSFRGKVEQNEVEDAIRSLI